MSKWVVAYRLNDKLVTTGFEKLREAEIYRTNVLKADPNLTEESVTIHKNDPESDREFVIDRARIH